MILNIDVKGKDFVVTKLPEPKVDAHGVQREDRFNGLPVWNIQLVATDDDGGEIIHVTVTGTKAPDLEVGDPVEVTGLVAKPWAANGRTGVSFKAKTVRTIHD